MATDTLSRTLSALADPTRRRILQRLARGRATVNQLAEPFEMSLPAVSKHLKVLERARLIERGREKQWRPCSLRPEPLRDAVAWLESCREVWEANYARLDDVLAELKQTQQPKPKPKRGNRK
ncbi:MAG: winged helix-turn-helix transcriptional regulator [Planctomycetes bacterium]|nr:winged helix-turn-helix transcriptional regulator [Planctomycetota bacterium]